MADTVTDTGTADQAWGNSNSNSNDYRLACNSNSNIAIIKRK